MKPYYDEDGITIYHGDCREVLPQLTSSIGSIITDPPYPNYHTAAYSFDPLAIRLLDEFSCHQFVFWSASEAFPLDYSAIHIWDKKVGVLGPQYEHIFERNGGTAYRMFNHYLINSSMAARYQHDTFTGHPSQKPLRLIRELVELCLKGPILDPFMGSGTTLLAARDAQFGAIGIEIEERYCEIAAQRLAQGVLSLPRDSIEVKGRCPVNYWEPGLGPCICEGRIHQGLSANSS